MKKLMSAMAFAFASAAFAASPAWVYYPSENIISNDDAVGKSTGYVLNVAVIDAAARTLAVGNGTKGDAFKTIGGTMLDLSERIEDADGAQWMITKLNGDCLRNTSASYTTIVFPKELKSSSGQQLNDRPSGLTQAVFDCPLLEGALPVYFMTSCSAATVNLPKITSLGASSFCAAGNVTDWNFGGVETVASGAFGWSHQTGTLNLPALKKMGRVVNNMRYDRVNLGTARCSLQEVEDKAFASSPDNTWFFTKMFVLGGAEGWTVGSAAFTANDLQRVVMLGAVPTFADSEIAFGPTNAAAKTIAFYVPKSGEWASIADAATPLAEDEITAFKTAHPTWDVPFGVVSKDVFQTANDQYLGWVEDRGAYGYKIDVSVANRSAGQYADDSVTIKVDGEEWTSDSTAFPANCEVTVTATTDANAKISWEGTIPDGTTPTDSSFTFKLTDMFKTSDAVSLNVRFTHPWEYDATAKTISDGYWTLVVKNTSGRALQLGAEAKDRTDGRTSVPWAFPNGYATTSPAELDLTGAIYTKGKIGDANEVWTITKIMDSAFKNDTKDEASTNTTKAISSFYAPTTLTSIGFQVFQNNYSMTNVVFRCPELTGTLGTWGWDFSSVPIERLVLATPKLTKIYQDNFGSMTLADTDLATWDLAGMKEIGSNGLLVKGGPGPSGELVLPNVETIGTAAFANWTRLSSAALGTNGTLKTVGAKIFYNNTGLKKLDFGQSYDFTADENAFMASDTTPLALEELSFTSKKAPSVATLDALLAGRELNDDGTKPVVIYAPMTKNAWQALKSAIADDEKAEAAALAAKGVRIDGVYVTAAGKRVAWLALHPDFEYRGFMLIVQ